MVPIYSTFLFCLSLWPVQRTTTIIRQDLGNRISLGPTFFFQQSQIRYMVVQHTKMEIPYIHTIIFFVNFPLYFISYSPLVKQYSFEGDFQFFRYYARLPGYPNMRNNLKSLSQLRFMFLSFSFVCQNNLRWSKTQ